MSVDGKRSVKVQMETKIRQGQKTQTVSLKGKGNVYIKKGHTYLFFKELHNEKINVQTTVKIGQDEVTIIRQGDLSMRQRYAVGENIEGTYRSPYGFWKTNADTHAFTYDWPEHKTKGKLQLKYDYFLQDEPSGTFDVKILIEEEN